MPPLDPVEFIAKHRATTTTCDAAEAARRIRERGDLLVVDVREPAEFAAGAVEGAVNIPRGMLEFQIGSACESEQPSILLHCKSGGRAVLAARTLRDMGYEDVVVYAGPIEDLLAACDSAGSEAGRG